MAAADMAAAIAECRKHGLVPIPQRKLDDTIVGIRCEPGIEFKRPRVRA